MAKDSSGNNDIPELGMAAAAFACFLVVVSVEHPSSELLEAVRIFAVTIPVSVAGVFVGITQRGDKENWARITLWILRLGCVLVGDVGSGIGVYWVFSHVSNVAAGRFLATSLLAWLAVGLLTLIVGLTGAKRGQAEKSS
jgi:hypothetical protein